MNSTFRLIYLFVLVPALLASCSTPTQSPPLPEATYAWQMIESVNTPMQRHENAYVAVGDLFYLVGGRGERPVQVYNPATMTWEDRSAPPFQMHHYQAVSYDGKIYVMGAFTEGFPYEKPIPNIYIYDPATDAWTQGPEIPEDRRRGAAAAIVYNNKFYIVSGITNGHADGHVPWLDSYDPQTGEWTKLADAPRARDHFQVDIIDGKLYAAGGRRSSFATGQTMELTTPEVDVYDIATDAWTTLPPSANIPTQRAGAATVAYNGKLLVIGGESTRVIPGMDPQLAHDEVEAFDPATGAWETLPHLVQGRHATQAILHNNMIYLAAGSRTPGGTEINTHEVFKPVE